MRPIRSKRREKLAIVLVICATLGGISLFSWLYSAAGLHPFFAALAGVLTYALIPLAINKCFNRDKRNDDPHDQIIRAINEVARGNFNVMLDLTQFTPHNDMMAAFNKMARDLGDLETMRQDFISNVSHEIQSPLTSIKGFAELLKNDALPDRERRRYAEIIESESRRLSALSDNLLKLSSLDKNPLNKTEFRLDKQIEKVALLLEPQWSAKNIDFEVDLEKTLIIADEDLTSQVWINLLGNAIKFTSGSIKITLRNNVVTIADSGAGIEPSDAARIFERFYKADKARDRSLGGNGLGLSIVKKIIDMHGFEILVESERGKGAAFTVRLH